MSKLDDLKHNMKCMCELHKQKLRGKLRRGTAWVESKVSKEASLSNNEFELLVYTLLLKGQKLGLKLLLLHGESIHFVKDLLLLLGKSTNIIN